MSFERWMRLDMLESSYVKKVVQNESRPARTLTLWSLRNLSTHISLRRLIRGRHILSQGIEV